VVLPPETIEIVLVIVEAQITVPLFTAVVTLSSQSPKAVDVDEVPTLIENDVKQLVAVTVAEAHGFK
jgi:hypothetical protein